MTRRPNEPPEHSAIWRVRFEAKRIKRERPEDCGPDAWRRFDEMDRGDGRNRGFAKLDRSR